MSFCFLRCLWITFWIMYVFKYSFKFFTIKQGNHEKNRAQNRYHNCRFTCYYIFTIIANRSNYLIFLPTQVDHNGIVYDPKTDRKCRKNDVLTAVYCVDTVRFR